MKSLCALLALCGMAGSVHADDIKVELTARFIEWANGGKDVVHVADANSDKQLKVCAGGNVSLDDMYAASHKKVLIEKIDYVLTNYPYAKLDPEGVTKITYSNKDQCIKDIQVRGSLRTIKP